LLIQFSSTNVKRKSLNKKFQQEVQKELKNIQLLDIGTGKIVLLTTVHRQSTDQPFIELLHRARMGAVTDEDLRQLRDCRHRGGGGGGGGGEENENNNKLNYGDDNDECVKRTHLCTHVRQAAARNKKELTKLTGLHVNFKCQDFHARDSLRRYVFPKMLF